MKKSRSAVILAVVLVCLALVGFFAYNVIRDTGKDGKNSISLGLDLSGGVSITYQIVTEDYSQTDVEDTKAKLEERASSYTTEYTSPEKDVSLSRFRVRTIRMKYSKS